MIFFLERLLYRLSANRAFFWLALTPTFAYLIIMAFIPNIHTISATFSVDAEAPIAETGTPTGYIPLETFLSDPALWETFLRENFNPQRIMGYPRGYGLSLSRGEVDAIYQETSALQAMKNKNTEIKTTYTGDDKGVGNHIVFYYSTTLHERIKEGYKRQASHLTPPQIAPPVVNEAISSRSLWSPSRTLPTLLCFIAGILVYLFIQIVRELMDDSYKSEKQIAEHTRLPILGSLPNMNCVPAAAKTPPPHDR
ncbi:hypothetical protein [Desulfoluna sp.]|uniref:hypothetical protein n=1 Tax=Desulfoluna sp. TaxID=2045199 RepID=UPI0026165A34|nr:hypothetical protein [Desulfoluna sp.]